MLKKILFLVTLLLILTLSVNAAEEYDFRNVNWGMSQEKVKENETAELILPSEEMLVYKNSINNKDYMLIYNFKDDTLYSAAYLFGKSFYDDNLYIDEYDYLQELLIGKYGEPLEDETYWFDDTYKYEYNDHGLAISIGDMAKRTLWETDTTKIGLALTGKEYEVNLGIKYDSINYSNLNEETLEDNKQEDQNQL